MILSPYQILKRDFTQDAILKMCDELLHLQVTGDSLPRDAIMRTFFDRLRHYEPYRDQPFLMAQAAIQEYALRNYPQAKRELDTMREDLDWATNEVGTDYCRSEFREAMNKAREIRQRYKL